MGFSQMRTDPPDDQDHAAMALALDEARAAAARGETPWAP
jgi:tRNA(adenine34) deaminase